MYCTTERPTGGYYSPVAYYFRWYPVNYGNGVEYIVNAASGTVVDPIRQGISAIASLKNLATNAKEDYDKAVAKFGYIVAYLGLYCEADDESWTLPVGRWAIRLRR